MIIISPTASDWQSEASELAVRRDGLKTNQVSGNKTFMTLC